MRAAAAVFFVCLVPAFAAAGDDEAALIRRRKLADLNTGGGDRLQKAAEWFMQQKDGPPLVEKAIVDRQQSNASASLRLTDIYLRRCRGDKAPDAVLDFAMRHFIANKKLVPWRDFIFDRFVEAGPRANAVLPSLDWIAEHHGDEKMASAAFRAAKSIRAAK